MFSLEEITELRAILSTNPITVLGRIKATNLIALYQALDREEALHAMLPKTPVTPAPVEPDAPAAAQ